MSSKSSGNRGKKGGSKALRILLKFSIGILTVGIMVVFYAVVVYGIKKAANYSYDFSYQVFGDVGVEEAPGRDVRLQILKGETTMNIATKLEDSRLIVNKYSFYLKTKLKKYDIMPGTFVLNTSMSYDDILDIITDYSNSIEAEETVEDVETSP